MAIGDGPGCPLPRAEQTSAVGAKLSDGALTARDAKAPESAYERKLCRLSFLAPDIQTAILDGRQPLGLTLDALLRSEIPLGWAKQRQLLGFD